MTGGVGKSSLVLRFIKGTFRESYIPTIEDTYRQVKAFLFLLHVSDFYIMTIIVDEETFTFGKPELYIIRRVRCDILDANIF